MTTIAIAVPLKPGKAEIWKRRSQELIRERTRDVERDWRRFGIHRSASWLQRTPDGDLAILYWELEDPEKLRERTQVMMSSNDDYYVMLRESLSDIFDLEQIESRPSSQLVLDHRLE